MTIGERIAQIRKEQGLSQEQFGERLGVSRQSISKWEADQSIPDVEKLIAMSQQYQISVGWLLGTEEERCPANELTDEQLRMVERIAEKYIESIPVPAIPEPLPKRRKKWPVSLGVVLAVVVLLWGVNTWGKLEDIENRQQSLEFSVSSIQNSVSRDIYGISNRVEEILKAQNSLLANYTASYGERDLRAGTIPITAAVTPKTYTPGMEIEFLLDDGVTSQRIPGVGDENHSFAMEAEGNLTDDITLSVVLRTGQAEQTQVLECWTDLLRITYLDDSNATSILNLQRLADLASLNASRSFGLYFTTQYTGETEAPNLCTIWLILNGETTVKVEPIRDTNRSFVMYEWKFPAELLNEMQDGDELIAACQVTDQYGRQYVTSMTWYEIEDGMFEMTNSELWVPEEEFSEYLS